MKIIRLLIPVLAVASTLAGQLLAQTNAPAAPAEHIGTNNSNKDDNTEADILEGVTAIVKQIRTRLPDTKLIVLGIFPRGKTFNAQRGKILQVNQALEKLADNKMVFYVDIGAQMIEADGSISTEMMR